MHRLKTLVVCVFCLASASLLALATSGGHTLSGTSVARGRWQPPRDGVAWSRRPETGRRTTPDGIAQQVPSTATAHTDVLAGQKLFDRETFGGNGRTCVTCHGRETGTVSPEDARRRFAADPGDPLFVHDGSDDDDDGDGFGDGVSVTRMLDSATVLVRIRLHPDVSVKDHPEIKEVTVRRGIPTTLNTPALDPVLMLDGRQPTLQAQALGAIMDHAQANRLVTGRELNLLALFQQTPRFFSSPALKVFAFTGHHAPDLPAGRTASERRGRVFFEDLPPDFSVNPPNLKPGACAACHSGPMLNQTNEFLPVPVPKGTRFQSILVSELNAAGNPVTTFVFSHEPHDLNPATNQDGVPDGIIEVSSPDPGRALITGRADDFFPFPPGSFDHLNAFKIPSLWGVSDTAPYFHDNSAKTLEDVAEHYRRFFLIVSDPDGPGPAGPLLVLTERDKKDMVAYMNLLR